MSGADSPAGTAMHNDVPIACRLPPEILSKIFMAVSSIDPPHRGRRDPDDGSLGWLTITHVCQLWRNVALQDPVLWAANIIVPFPFGEPWASAFLSRAQNARNIVNRCSYLTLDTLTSSDAALTGANIARTHAILCLRTSYDAMRKLCTPVSTLGAVSFTPLLHAHLVFVDLGVFPPGVPGAMLASMFAALHRMPGLERLTLRMEPIDAQGLPLRALKSLSIHSSVRAAARLLAHLALPAAVRVHCNMEYAHNLPTDLPPFVSALAACVDALRASKSSRPWL
ncbi:hypothetical protein FA95DRAFT_1559894, partial [Auriscalpium vulgare]